MVKTVETLRLYKIADSEMIQLARVFFNLFTADKAQFKAFDADFDSPAFTRFEELLLAAESEAQEMMVKDELAQLTEKVQQEMVKCRDYFQKLKYFIEKAFPGNKAIQLAFGYEDYAEIFNSEHKMLRFMNALKIQVEKHKAALIVVGLKTEDATLVNTLYQQLMDADEAQEMFKKDKLLLTQGRIELFNSVWEFVVKINRAAKFIFTGNYAKLKQYELPGEEKTEEVPAEENQPAK